MSEITLRDLFAALYAHAAASCVMQRVEMLTARNATELMNAAPSAAYQFADAMLKARGADDADG